MHAGMYAGRQAGTHARCLCVLFICLAFLCVCVCGARVRVALCCVRVCVRARMHNICLLRSCLSIQYRFRTVRLCLSDLRHSQEHHNNTFCTKVVKDMTEAMAHINAHGSRHTDCIITKDAAAAAHFQSQVDAAGVYWNVSSRSDCCL